MKIEKKCYVCGLQLDEYPYNDPGEVPRANDSVICPACGIHYGYDDEGAGNVIPDELTYSGWKFGDENHIKIIQFWRKKWIDEGMKWWSLDENKIPYEWNPNEQLKNVPEEFK